MRRQTSVNERNPLTLSFLDVMSCGLCGMLMLFFIFSILPQGGMLSESAAAYSGADSKESLAGIRSSEALVQSQRFPLNVSVESRDLTDASKPNSTDSIASENVRWDLPKNAVVDSQSHTDLPFRTHVFSSSGLRRGATASFLIHESVFLKTSQLVLEVNLVGVGESSEMTVTISRQDLGKFSREGSFIEVFVIDPGNKDAPIVAGGDPPGMEVE